ncbi:MAG: hypothetical protein ICV61_12480, partial [Microcoleus sp. Co-bin12]|nr:hypothetical protein [Microcoleus sp. Co-bin12]
MEQIDCNFSKSVTAKGTQKRAAIGNLVFEPDSQCCRIDRPYTGKSGTPRNWRRELMQSGQSQPNIATAASLSSSEKSS